MLLSYSNIISIISYHITPKSYYFDFLRKNNLVPYSLLSLFSYSLFIFSSLPQPIFLISVDTQVPTLLADMHPAAVVGDMVIIMQNKQMEVASELSCYPRESSGRPLTGLNIKISFYLLELIILLQPIQTIHMSSNAVNLPTHQAHFFSFLYLLHFLFLDFF
jgi:hypothetical protein